MASIPPSRRSSMLLATDDFIEELAGPLLDRCRLGHPALGIAFYEGDALDARWPAALEEWARTRGLYVEHNVLPELGTSPARRLLERRRVGEHLFSIEI